MPFRLFFSRIAVSGTRILGGIREVHAMTRVYMSLTIAGSHSDSEAEAQMDLDVYRVRCARDESGLVRDHAEIGGGHLKVLLTPCYRRNK